MIRSCQGPAGQPGMQVEHEGEVSECFWWEPGDPASFLQAEAGAARALRDMRPELAEGVQQ